MRVQLRPLIYTIASVVILILIIAAVASPVLTQSGNGFKSEVTMWRSCTTSNGVTRCADLDDGVSSCYLDHIRAMRAFGLLALFAMVFAVVLGVLDFCKILQRIPDKVACAPERIDMFLMCGTAALTSVFCLITWAAFAALWNTGCDGSKLRDATNARWGASAPLFIICWMASGALCIVPFVIARPSDDLKTTDPHVQGPHTVQPVAPATTHTAAV